MFHAKSSIAASAADVAQTYKTQLESKESGATFNFIAKMSENAPRGNMTKLKDHIYAIGFCSFLTRACCNGNSEQYLMHVLLE